MGIVKRRKYGLRTRENRGGCESWCCGTGPQTCTARGRGGTQRRGMKVALWREGISFKIKLKLSPRIDCDVGSVSRKGLS